MLFMTTIFTVKTDKLDDPRKNYLSVTGAFKKKTLAYIISTIGVMLVLVENSDNQQLNDPFHRVYHFLRLKDLYRLACVSRKFYNDVENYCELICKRFTSEDLDRVFNKQLILDSEVSLRNEIESSGGSFFRNYLIYLMLFRFRRISVAKCQVAWLGDDRYIVPEHDNDLQRTVVRLITICWLDIKKSFARVLPGAYKALIRMDIQDGSWPSGREGTNIRVHWNDCHGNHEMRINLPARKWKRLRYSLVNNLRRMNDSRLELGNGWKVRNYDSTTGWFDFCLDWFYVGSTCDVRVEFSDFNGSWKDGIRWDYIELMPISTSL